MTEVDTLVRPFYMRLLHGNFLREEKAVRASLFVALHGAVPFADKAITRLLNSGGWRERLSAAWFVGLLKLGEFEERITELLLRSETCFAGQGYCFALARIASDSSATSLQHYLSKYLPVGMREYDQEWAIGALYFLDRAKAASVPMDHSTWQPMNPEEGISDFKALMVCVGEEW